MAREGDERPNQDGFEGLWEGAAEQSLAADLGAVVDEANQLEVDLGLRPYRVFSVVVAWDGGQVGRGGVRVVRETEIVPTPLIRFSMGKDLDEAGRRELGSATMTRLSPRYTEDEVEMLFHRNLGPAEQGFIEVVMDGRFQGAGEPRRRRFVVARAPWLDQEHFEWRVTLRAQVDPRTRAGGLR